MSQLLFCSNRMEIQWIRNGTSSHSVTATEDRKTVHTCTLYLITDARRSPAVDIEMFVTVNRLADKARKACPPLFLRVAGTAGRSHKS